MKKLFTPLLLFLTVLLGGISASAEDEVFELTADMFYTWTGFDKDAIKGSQYQDVKFNIGNDVELGGGGVVCGNDDVSNWLFADLTGSSKLIIEGSAGVTLRVMMNRQEDNSLIEKPAPIGKDGTVEVDLTDLPYVHLNTIKVNWGGSGTVNSIKFVKPSDPLAVPKEQLKNQISTAKMYNAIAYTEGSFADLQTAISAGETALKAADATVESLGTAVTNIANAIDSLTLAEEYSNLTAAMFKTYSSVNDPKEVSGAGCAYDIFKSTGMPYGDGGVGYLNWADLTKYDKLIVTFASGTPRFCMNRTTAEGQEWNGGMFDMVAGNGNASTASYLTPGENIVTIDLNKMVAECGYARLHSIKGGNNANVFVTGMYLYKAADPLKMPKEALQTEIDNAKLYDEHFKTEESWTALQSAITAAETAVNASDATESSISEASANLAVALEGLTLQKGYSNLTAEMFNNTNICAYDLFKSSDLVYGDNGVGDANWADLKDYDLLIITVKEGTPRLCMNRVDGGGQGATQADSKMLDINPNAWTNPSYWSTEAYQTVNNEKTIFTINLNKIVNGEGALTGYGFAHLNCIKGSDGKVNVTGLYLYKASDKRDLLRPELSKAIADAQKYDPFKKTQESVDNLVKAISNGQSVYDNENASEQDLQTAIDNINEAFAKLSFEPGYSILRDVNYKNHSKDDNLTETSNDPTCSYVLNEITDTPYGDGSVGYLNWADLTDYDELIVTYTGDKKPRVMMNRKERGRNEIENGEYVGLMLEMKEGNDYPSTKSYLAPTDKGCIINLKNIVDDQDYAHLNAIKYSYGESGVVTGMYLYKDPTEGKQFDVTFEIDDPNNVVIEVDGESQNLKSGNVLKVKDRAKLYVKPADKYKLTSVTSDNKEVALNKDYSFTKTVVKNITYNITTEKDDPLAPQKSALTAIIDNAKLYDGTAKTDKSFQTLTDAIKAAEAELENEKATETSLKEKGDAITAAIKGLTIDTAAGYSNLTTDLYKKHESLANPVEKEEDLNCACLTFEATELPYGIDKSNDCLNWADLFDYDKLIITTDGNFGPQIFINRLEANGKQAGTMEESKMIDIDPNTADAWSSKYLTIEDNEYNEIQGKKYTIDLKQILADYGFVRLHSIQSNTYERSIFVTGMYLKKDPTTNVDLTFDIDDPDHVVIKVGDEVLTGLEAGENTKALPFRGKLSIGPAEGFEIKSLTADGKDVALTDKEYTTTILKEVAYKIVTVDPKIIKLNFNIDDASHVVISANEKEIKNLVNGSNDVEVEKGSKISIAAAKGFVLSSVKAGEVEVELTDGAYTTTVSEPVNYTILTEAEKPADPNALTGAWWHQWDGFGADAQIIETTKEIVDNLGKEVKNGTVILGNPACDGDCYADLSEYGGVEGKATAGTTVRFYFNRIDVQGAGIDIQLKTDAEGKFSYEFDELNDGGNPVSFVHLAFVKIVGDGEVESIKVLPKPSAEALAKKNLTKEIDRANLYDSYAKTDASWNKLETAISEANAALTKEDATVASLEAAKAAINEAIEGLELKEGYSYFTADMFKKYDSVENPGDGKAIENVNFKLFETTDQPLGGGNIDELEWADLTNYDKLVLTVKEGTPRILMNRLEHGIQEYENGEYTGKFLDMTAGDNHYSTERYLTSEGNAYIVDLAKMVDDFGFARLNALKFHGLVNGLYLYYKDPNVKREYDLTFDIDNASHVVVKVNGETKDMTKNSVLKVADRAKLSIAPATDYVLESVTANDESVELKDGSLTKTIVKNIAYRIVTADADPLTQPKKDLTAIIENAKLYDGTAKTEDSFAALTAAIAAAEAELDSEKADKESLKSAGDAITKAIENLVLAPYYSKLTVDMFKTHESFENPVVTDEDPGCANGLFTSSELPYGNNNNDYLKWADLSDYTQLVITTDGNYAPEFFLNRLEANGKQGATKEESKLIDINPGSADAWSSKYLTVEGKKYTVDLKKIVKDFGFARLHSIKSNTYEKGILVTGMYLYKAPFVAVTGISLDKSDEIVTVGETLTLKATVAPANATDSDVIWSSSNPKVASVDENGVVTALEVGKAVITASCGEFTAKCTVKCHSTVGDANWDGKITVTDAVHISNYVVQDFEVPEGWTAEDHKEFYERSANVNGDGRVTFADASATVNLALAQPASAPEQNRVSAANDDTADALVIGHVSATSSGNVVPVALDNSMEYVALQADIIIPEGMNVEVKAGSRVAGSHTFQTRKFADNHIRVAIYNLGNVAFADSEAPIFEVVTDSDIMDSEDIVISNIYASDSKAVEYVLAARMAAPSAVASIGFDANAPVKVFDLNGIYVSDTMEGLQQGTYIVRQGDEAKKVRIR
ncbi:MAG: FIVAR domain-containing protein [Muribaculaceae bacterium]|nr:FIVAR domain-containing protein [Muribaculaceae bacterium]